MTPRDTPLKPYDFNSPEARRLDHLIAELRAEREDDEIGYYIAKDLKE